jgi:dTDP-4-dehydrorhamnose reductase
MANILVTGANGQLGSELRVLSNDLDHQLYFTDIEELDLRDIDQIRKFFKGRKIDICINCAAYTAVDKAETDINNAIAINVTAVRNLAEICALYETLLIHISTDFVFDGSNNKPYLETDRAKPINVYGQSKYEGENQALKENDATIIIRTSWMYSTFGTNFVKSILKAGKDKGDLNIIFDQIGTPTYAADLAEAVLQIIEKVLRKGKSDLSGYLGVFHYSNEGTTSWYDFAVEIFKLAGIDCRIKPIHTFEYPTASKRPYYSVLDKTKIKSTFGLTIPYWRESLKVCMKKLGY